MQLKVFLRGKKNKEIEWRSMFVDDVLHHTQIIMTCRYVGESSLTLKKTLNTSHKRIRIRMQCKAGEDENKRATAQQLASSSNHKVYPLISPLNTVNNNPQSTENKLISNIWLVFIPFPALVSNVKAGLRQSYNCRDKVSLVSNISAENLAWILRC